MCFNTKNDKIVKLFTQPSRNDEKERKQKSPADFSSTGDSYFEKARLKFKTVICQSNPLLFGRKHLMRLFQLRLRLPSGALLMRHKYW